MIVMRSVLIAIALAAFSQANDLNWWGPYIFESAPQSVNHVRALDLAVLDWDDPITLVIVGNTTSEVDDTLEVEFAASRVELDGQSRDISEDWFIEYDNAGADDDGYGVFAYEDTSSTSVIWPLDIIMLYGNRMARLERRMAWGC